MSTHSAPSERSEFQAGPFSAENPSTPIPRCDAPRDHATLERNNAARMIDVALEPMRVMWRGKNRNQGGVRRYIQSSVSAPALWAHNWMATADARRWRRLVYGAALVALLIRTTIALNGFGGSTNLAIFTYFSGFVARGINPYHVAPLATAGGAIADEPIAEFVLYAGLLRLWDSPTTLRLFFAACDALTIVTIGLFFQRPRGWRLGAMAFIAANPLPLLAWTFLAEDKSVAMLLLVVVLAASERGRYGIAWAATGALTALKWMGGFFALPLLIEGVRRAGRRIVTPVVAAATVVVVATVPFFPDSLLGLERRSARMKSKPMFDSLTVLLANVDLYKPLLIQVGLPLALLVIALMHWRRKIDVTEAVSLGSTAGFVLLPDEGPDRILLVTMSLMFVVRPRWALWWAVSLVPFAWLLIDYEFALNHPLHRLIGAPGTWKHVIGANLLLLVVAASYVADKFADRLFASMPCSTKVACERST
jgi:hypothetical protein